MELKLIENLPLPKWEQALASLPLGAEILQSPVWQNISQHEFYKTHLFVWQKNEKLVALAQVLESHNVFGRFWYLPRGPVFLSDDSAKDDLYGEIIKDLKKKAKEKKVFIIRFEPSGVEIDNLKVDLAKKIKGIQPEKTRLLDISLSDDELLAQMHHKTRYNIRLAVKRGVQIERGSLDDLNLFYHLLRVTTKRDGFRGHSLDHYRRLLLYGQDKIELWLAKKDDKLLAAGIFSFYGARATYLHGASADSGRQHMAPYLLQWKMIKRAKELACRIYDFYGVDEKKWAGVSRFKFGFGGSEKKYPGTFVLVVTYSRYLIYKTAVYVRGLLKF